MTPWYSSTVLVEMVVVVLVESVCSTQVAVVEIVRQALQLVVAIANALSINIIAHINKHFFFIIPFFLLVKQYVNEVHSFLVG